MEIKPEFRLTKEQSKAISHTVGHLRIIACAGSGKTEVISQRIANLVKNGVASKNIVAFTFTEKAADEMKSRIRKILDEQCPNKADFGDMYVGTIHSFCFKMLQDLKPEYKNYDVLDPAKRVAYISKERNFSRLGLSPFRNCGKGSEPLQKYTVITRFIYSLDIIMNEDIDVSLLSNEQLREAYNRYRKMLHEDKYFDFSTMIHELVTILDNNLGVLNQLNDKIKHLVVDEYQDVNKLQERLVEFISRGADSVCVVGDDDQCIYQWRGSSVENIIEFKKRYSKKYEVTDIPLDINFRSTEAVVWTAREFIKKNKNRLTFKEMKHNEKNPRGYEKGDIIYHHVENEEDEHNYILAKIKEILGTDFQTKRGENYSISLADFAILVRTNSDAAKLVDFLEDHDIDCIAYSGSTIFRREEVLFTMDCISYIFQCSTYGYQPTPTISELRSKYEQVFQQSKFPTASVEKFIVEINQIKEGIDKIYRKTPKDYLGDLGLQAVYHKILSALGAQDFYFGDVYNYNLAVLSKAISDYEAVWIRLRASEIGGFFQFAVAYGESAYMETQFADPTRINVVKVMTVHKAKGLEFPVVFLPKMIKKRKANPTHSFVDENLYDFERYNGTEEDERRVFYTALTRAEKYLIITGASNRPETKKPHEPHSFIAELDKKFISNDINIKRSKSGHPPRLFHQAIFPTSFSELTTWDRCPHDYKLRHVYGYNAGVPAAFGYGTNIHHVLNVIHNQYILNKKVLSDQEINTLIDNMFHLRYATEKITKNMKNGAKKIIKNYVKLQKSEFRRILETEKRFEFVLESAIISGQIDLLKKVDDDGNITEVEIIDFKTENDKEDKPYQLDYEKQLRLYAIACLKSLGLNPKKAWIHHLDRTLIRKKTLVEINQEKLDQTKEEIKCSVDNILSKRFVPNPSKICKACDYRFVCNNKHKKEPLS